MEFASSYGTGRLSFESRCAPPQAAARGDESDRIVGLEIGADDYLPKTFSPRELLARLRAVTRRTQRSPAKDSSAPEPDVVVGRLRINPNIRVVILDAQPLELTPVDSVVYRTSGMKRLDVDGEAEKRPAATRMAGRTPFCISSYPFV